MDVSSLFRDALPSPLWEASAFLMGLIVGSFANVAIHRIPLGESIIFPRSRCPRCRELIRPSDNVPVLGWLVLRGRCRNCREPISWRYPAVEAANGLLYLAIALRWGPSLHAVVSMVLVTALLVLSLIDLDHQILPNVITIPGIVAGLLVSWLLGGWKMLALNAIAAASGYIGFAALWYAFLRIRKVDALGQGDWKLAAMLGAFLGGERLLLVIFFSSLAGSLLGLALMVVAGRSFQHKLPFGTFLGLMGIVVLFVGDSVIPWYKGLLA